ncbi:hypothetical protein LPJ66_012193, partial [Kickxella alabastrina]
IEDEFRKVNQLRPTMDNYRDEYAQLESRHNMAVIELSQAMERLRNFEDERQRLHRDKLHDQETIAALEESLREMEFGGAASGNSLESGLASAMAADDRSALLLKVARLERELDEAKRSTAAGATDFLEEVAETANREKDAALQELQRERELRKRAESEMAAQTQRASGAEMAIEEASRVKEDLQRVTEQLVASSTEISGVRSELAQARQELDRARASKLASEQERNAAQEALRRLDGNEAASLRAENMSLEEWYAESHEQSKQFQAEIDRLSAENRQLTQRMSQLQDELTRLDIRKREIESENKRLSQVLERQSAQLAVSSQFTKSDVDRLQKEVVSNREEIHTLQIAVKRSKDQLIHQN